MYDGGKIIAGLVVFFCLITFPFWYNVVTGKATYKPDPKIVDKSQKCIRPAAEMREEHMQILDDWRDEAVREGRRKYKGSGSEHTKSLSLTCLKCHPNKDEFCERCHSFVGVKPYCWDCHFEAKESKSWASTGESF